MSEFFDRPYSDSHLDELEGAAIRSRAKFFDETERSDRIAEIQGKINGEKDPAKLSKLQEELEIVKNPE